MASTSNSSSSNEPPVESAWINAYQRLSPRWQQSSALSSHSAIPIPISRVNQVDAGRLDIEMSAMLKEQLVKVFSVMKDYYFNTKQNLTRFLSFLSGGSRFGLINQLLGNALMNLRYRDERATDIRGKTCLELFYDNSVGVVELCFNVDSQEYAQN
ncbi:hypothetical protein Tco_0688195 [Tanacetum coccineum]